MDQEPKKLVQERDVVTGAQKLPLPIYMKKMSCSKSNIQTRTATFCVC